MRFARPFNQTKLLLTLFLFEAKFGPQTWSVNIYSVAFYFYATDQNNWKCSNDSVFIIQMSANLLFIFIIRCQIIKYTL